MKFGCLLLASLLLATSVRAQRTDPAADVPPSIFRATVDVVALNVVVTDGRQKFVAGLGQGDFAVYEDGVRQDVSFFASSAVPLDLAILIDTSASMTDKIATVQQAAVGFASTLRDTDRIIVIDIKDGAKIVAPLGADLEAAKQAIRATFPKGGTALYNGLYLGLKEMTRHRQVAARGGPASQQCLGAPSCDAPGEIRRQAIVVLSDGEDTSSLLGFDDVLALAKESGIAIYTIQPKSKYPTPTAIANRQKYFSQSEYAMKAFAQETGARAFFPASIDELSGVYDLIAEELAHQYSIGYTSKNPKHDGSYRRVIVRVSDPRGTQTRTRSGYFAARVN